MQNTEAKSLKEAFKKIMQQRILSGELKPGDRLPPERVLSEELEISRGSINQGILDLERAGFLRIVPRKGTFVAEYVRNATPMTLSAIMAYDSALIDPRLFRDLMDMRILVECECVKLASKNISAAAAEMLKSKTDSIYSASGEPLAEALYDYHLYIVSLSCNSAYSMIFQSFEKMLKNLFNAHYSDPKELSKCLPLYGALTASLCQGDTQNAGRIIADILSMASEYLNSNLSNDHNATKADSAQNIISKAALFTQHLQ